MSSAGQKLPIAREGVVFILPLIGVAMLLWALELVVAAGFISLLACFVIYFFRDPDRPVPAGEKAVLSPADGKVLEVTSCKEERFLKGPAIKISIFMSPLDVHVNRIPLTGHIVERAYFPGKFFRANLDKASALNEHNALVIETPAGIRVLAVQIAGFIARRIVCYVNAGDRVVRGQRFGMIRFGSRMDIYLPEKTRVRIRPGEKTFGGKTILGFLP